MQIQTLTFEQLIGTVAVALLLVGAYNTVMNAVKTRQRRREQPVSNLEDTVQHHEEKLARDHDRLNQLEESNRIQLRALMALMSHELNGNSNDALKASYDEIQKFLIAK